MSLTKWTTVYIPLTLKKTKTHATILFVHKGNRGEFSVASVPHSAIRINSKGAVRMQEHIAKRIEEKVKRYQGKLYPITPHLSYYVFGPIGGKYYTMAGKVIIL